MSKKMFNIISVAVCVILIIVNLLLMNLRLQGNIYTITGTNDSLKVNYYKLESNLESIENRLKAIESKWNKINNISEKISILAPKINSNSKLKLAYYIYYYGEQYDNSELLEDIMISLPYVESTYNKYALGKAGEIGYYQIHPIHINKEKLKMNIIYSEKYQVKKAYQILNEKFNVFSSMQYAINGYNGWASKNNPYYGKVVIQLKKIKSI